MKSHGKGGFREGSGRKRKGLGAVDPGFTLDELAWINRVVAESPVKSADVKRATAIMMVTALRFAALGRSLLASQTAASDDAKSFSACFRTYLKALDMLKLAEPEPPKDPFADDDEPEEPRTKRKERDPLLEELAE